MASIQPPSKPGRFALPMNPLANLFEGSQAPALPTIDARPPANGAYAHPEPLTEMDAPSAPSEEVKEVEAPSAPSEEPADQGEETEMSHDESAEIEPTQPTDPSKNNYSDTTAAGLVDPSLMLPDAPPLTDKAEVVEGPLTPAPTNTFGGEGENDGPSTELPQYPPPSRVPTPQPPTTVVRVLPLPPREVLPAQLAVLSRRLRYPAAQRLRFLQIFSIYMHFQLGGDLDRVVQEYHDAVELFRGDANLHVTLRTFGLDTTPFGELQPFEARTVGGQRLEALALLRDGLRNMIDTGRYSQITDSILLEVLEHLRWVVENAAAWIIQGGDLDQIIDRIADLRTPHPTQYQEDERWARFIKMTSTNSHYSAQQFLADRQYDYAAALNDWARLGHIPFLLAPSAITTGQKSKGETAGRKVLRLRDVIANHESEDGAGHSVEPLDSTIEGSEIVQRRLADDEGNEIVERKENDGDFLLPDDDEPSWNEDARPTYETAERTGFIIDPDTSPPILGYPDPTKFDIERVVKGKYTPLSHELKKSMDWNSEKNIATLRKWRNEEYAKTTRVLKRPKVVAFVRAEIDFLYFEEARHFEHAFRHRMRRISRANPGMAQQEARLRTMAWFDEVPVRYKIAAGYQDRITKRFNKKFAGKTVVDGVLLSAGARPERSSSSLNQQRHRSRMLCRDFMVSYQPARGSRVLPAGRTDDEDSDYKNGLKRPRPWAQSPADSDDTNGGGDSSDPGSTDGEGRDDSDDDDGDSRGGPAAAPTASSRRVTRQSQGQVNDGSSSGQAAGNNDEDSAITEDVGDAIQVEDTEEVPEDWYGDDEDEDDIGDGG